MNGDSERSTPPPESPVGRYQATVLDLLHDGVDGRVMAEQLERAAELLGVDLGPIDATLLEVAADLTRHWGQRS